MNENFVLMNGIKIPKVGFGTWQIPEGDICYNSVISALKHGYRHIDTAGAYKNEKSVGRAVIDFKINRKDVFITSKVSAEIKSYSEAVKAIEDSLNLLNLEYIDLMLIHAPKPWSKRDSEYSYDKENLEVWQALIEAYKANKIRAIGVSNFKIRDLENLISNSDVIPMVNQIRYFVGNTQEELVEYCKDKNILVQAYSPLATGRLLNNPKIESIAKKLNRTLPQIAIRYCLENGVLPLPKSVHDNYIKENFDVEFSIPKEDMDYLNSLEDILE